MVRPGLRLALLASAQFTVALDYNIVYVALPDIGRKLGFTGSSLQWVVSAYAVGFGGFLLLGGRAVDRLGRRRVFIVGFALFGASCLVGGFAPNSETLIAARVAQGIGAALLSPATLSLINSSYPEGKPRNHALAVWGASGSGGLAAGALLGGVLTDAWGWRSVLFAMVPLTVAGLIVAPRWLAVDGARVAGFGDFDLLGALSVTAGSALLVFGLVGGPQYGWASARSSGAFAAGAVFLGIFLLIERRSRDPLVPLRVLGNRSLTSSMAIILLFQSTLAGTYYLFTTYLQNGLGYTPLVAGLAFLPLTVVSMAASLKLTPALITRWGVRATLAGGMLVNGIGVASLASAMSRSGSFWVILPGLVIWGLGGGVTFPAMFVAASAGVEPVEQGIASAMAVTSQQIGGALGLAALIAIADRSIATGGMPTSSVLIDGLRSAGWVAGAASAAGALIAFLLKPGSTTSREIIISKEAATQ